MVVLTAMGYGGAAGAAWAWHPVGSSGGVKLILAEPSESRAEHLSISSLYSQKLLVWSFCI